jgi:gliding motility-associated-like protein
VVPHGNLWVPNAFTPNGDGVNDLFELFSINVVDFHLEIFSRWGELMFISDDIGYSWDGKYQNKVVPEGAYVWVAKVTLLNGDKPALRGSVTVIR